MSDWCCPFRFAVRDLCTGAVRLPDLKVVGGEIELLRSTPGEWYLDVDGCDYEKSEFSPYWQTEIVASLCGEIFQRLLVTRCETRGNVLRLYGLDKSALLTRAVVPFKTGANFADITQHWTSAVQLHPLSGCMAWDGEASGRVVNVPTKRADYAADVLETLRDAHDLQWGFVGGTVDGPHVDPPCRDMSDRWFLETPEADESAYSLATQVRVLWGEEQLPVDYPPSDDSCLPLQVVMEYPNILDADEAFAQARRDYEVLSEPAVAVAAEGTGGLDFRSGLFTWQPQAGKGIPLVPGREYKTGGGQKFSLRELIVGIGGDGCVSSVSARFDSAARESLLRRAETSAA